MSIFVNLIECEKIDFWLQIRCFSQFFKAAILLTHTIIKHWIRAAIYNITILNQVRNYAIKNQYSHSIKISPLRLSCLQAKCTHSCILITKTGLPLSTLRPLRRPILSSPIGVLWEKTQGLRRADTARYGGTL